MNSKVNIVAEEIGPSMGGRLLANLQKVGKSLVFPIAVLPAAAILNRLGGLIAGYGAMDGAAGEQFAYWIGKMIETPGAVVFGNLAAVFAIGVSFGFAKDKRGEAALIGFVSFLALDTLVSNESASMANMIYQNTMVTGSSTLDPTNAHFGKQYSEALYLVIKNDAGEILSATWTTSLGVFGGIVAGLFTAFFYNRYSDTRLPKALGFFSGRRFVPMIALIAMVPIALGFGIVWPWIQYALTAMGQAMQTVPAAGAGVYAFANRLLIPFGLHQVLNTFFWFQMPVEGFSQIIFDQGIASGMITDVADPAQWSAWIESLGDGAPAIFSGMANNQPLFMIQGDINAHVQAIEGSGAFQTGFFPVMMFGLPAMGMAMARNAEEAHKKAVWTFMISAGVVSFLTGITEPLEFAFAFTSPILYGLYSLISGFVAAATVGTGAMSGFGFSAGLIDLMVSMPNAALVSTGASAFGSGYGHMVWIPAIGLMSMPIYYFLADILIRKANLATPGRNGNIAGLTSDDNDDDIKPVSRGQIAPKWTRMAKESIDYVGRENISEIDNCITRLRLTVKSNNGFDINGAQKMGFTGYVKTGTTQAHFVYGTEVEIIANEMRRLLAEGYGVITEIEIEESTKEIAKESTKEIAKKKVANLVKKTTKKPIDLSGKTVNELRRIAKTRNLKGYSVLNKAQLIRVIEKDLQD